MVNRISYLDVLIFIAAYIKKFDEKPKVEIIADGLDITKKEVRRFLRELIEEGYFAKGFMNE